MFGDTSWFWTRFILRFRFFFSSLRSSAITRERSGHGCECERFYCRQRIEGIPTTRRVYVTTSPTLCAPSTPGVHPLISLNSLRMTESSRKLVAITSFRCVDNRVDFRLVLSNEQTNRNEDDDGYYRYCRGSTSEKKIVCARHTNTTQMNDEVNRVILLYLLRRFSHINYFIKTNHSL